MQVDRLYETPRTNIQLNDCWFYHTIELPEHGVIPGYWDLRGIEKEYLGGVDIAGKRVLEIGPASGYLTSYMNRAGAEVTAVEQGDDDVWDFVPYQMGDDAKLADLIRRKKRVNEQMKKSFWLTYEKMKLDAKVHYGQVAALPEELGHFDVSLLAMVLTHMRDPLNAIMECAKRTDETMIVVDRTYVDDADQDKPIMQLIPDKNNKRYDSWWYFSKGLFRQLFELMGFSEVNVNRCECLVNGKPYPVSVFVAKR